MRIDLTNKPALFLDRDGVINVRPENDYVKHTSEFQFIEGVIESIALLNKYFYPVVVVTNQQGVGKGIMTIHKLEQLHVHMIEQIKKGGGVIHSVYHCGDIEGSGSLYRKPAVGMGLLARRDFPVIRFKNSFMVGDTYTDMLFGKRLGMHTVLIDSDPGLARKYDGITDMRFDSLISFARRIVQQCK